MWWLYRNTLKYSERNVIPCNSLAKVVTEIWNKTEWNGMVPPPKIWNAQNRTVTFGSLASMALIMACSLSITRGYFALRMAGMSCSRVMGSCLYTLLEKFLVCVRKLVFNDQEHCRDDTH